MTKLARGPYVAMPENHPSAREDIRRMTLPSDGTEVVLTGEVRGADTINAFFHADGYDRLLVSMTAASRNCAFNVYSPGQDDAYYDGWADGLDWGDTLDRTGEHRIEIYMGHKATRNEASTFALKIQRFED